MYAALAGVMAPPRDERSDLQIPEPVTYRIDPKAERLTDAEVKSQGFVPQDGRYFELLGKAIATDNEGWGFTPAMDDIACAEDVPREVLEAVFETDFLLAKLYLDGGSLEATDPYGLSDEILFDYLFENIRREPIIQDFERPLPDQEIDRMYRKERIPVDLEKAIGHRISKTPFPTDNAFGDGEWIDRDTLFDNSRAIGPTAEMSPSNLRYGGLEDMGPGFEARVRFDYEMPQFSLEEERELLDLFRETMDQYGDISIKK